MEKALVLRLLIYGIVTQVGDKEHACGGAATGNSATSFRRADGITIVCLPLPPADHRTSTDTAKSNSHVTSHQAGITLHIATATPNRVDVSAAKANDRAHSDGRQKSFGTADFEYSTTTVPYEEDREEPEKPAKPKPAKPKYTDDQDSGEDDSDTRDKRKADEKPKPVPRAAPLTMPNKSKREESEVEYDKTDTRKPKPKPEEQKQPEEEPEEESEEEPEEEKPPPPPPPKVKPKQKPRVLEKKAPKEDQFEKIKLVGDKQPEKLSVAGLQDILDNNENDDEVEQYILIRRRRKKKKPDTSNASHNKDIMLPLASTDSATSTADDSTEVESTKSKPPVRKKANKSRRTKKTLTEAHDDRADDANNNHQTKSEDESNLKENRSVQKKRKSTPSNRKSTQTNASYSSKEENSEQSENEVKPAKKKKIKKAKTVDANQETTDNEVKPKKTKPKTKGSKKRSKPLDSEDNSTDESLTSDHKPKQIKRNVEHSSDSDNGNEVHENAQSKSNSDVTVEKTKTRKTKRKKKQQSIKSEEQETSGSSKMKKRKDRFDENKWPRVDKATDEEERTLHTAQHITAQPPPPKSHQIFIIHVPITQHNNFTTTLTTPAKEVGPKEEDNFKDFLKVFNFTLDDATVHTGSDELGDGGKRTNGGGEENDVGDDKPKDEYGGVKANNKHSERDERDTNEETQKEVKESKKPDTIGDLWKDKRYSSGKTDKNNDDQQDNKVEDPKDDYNNNNESYKSEEIDEKEQEPPPKKKRKPQGQEPDSVYKLIKVTQVSVEQGDHNKAQQHKPVRLEVLDNGLGNTGVDSGDSGDWPRKNGRFRHSYKHSFQFNKHSGSGHESFQKFFQEDNGQGDGGKHGDSVHVKPTVNKQKETDEGDEGKQTKDAEKGKDEQIVWKMIKKMHNVPWFKPEDQDIKK